MTILRILSGVLSMLVFPLAADLMAHYGIVLDGIWSDTLTLGALFARVVAKPPAPNIIF